MTIFIDDKPIRFVQEKDFGDYLKTNNEILEDFDRSIDVRLVPFKPQSLSGRTVILNASLSTVDKFFNYIFEGKPGDYLAVTFVIQNLEEVKQQIKTYYKIVKAAGGVIFNAEGKILLIHRLGKWDLPKGKKDAGENSRQTAEREVEEECKVKVILGEKLCTTWHTYSLNGNKILKRTKWYKMICTDDSEMKPQLEENISELKWMDEKEIKNALMNSYSSIRYVFNHLENKQVSNE